MRGVVRVDRSHRRAVELDRAASGSLDLGEERVAQSGVPVELVDRDVNQRVGRQVEDRAADPAAVAADEVGDPVGVLRAELRANRRDRLERELRAAVGAGSARRGGHRGRQVRRPDRDVEADQHAENRDRSTHRRQPLRHQTPLRLKCNHPTHGSDATSSASSYPVTPVVQTPSCTARWHRKLRACLQERCGRSGRSTHPSR